MSSLLFCCAVQNAAFLAAQKSIEQEDVRRTDGQIWKRSATAVRLSFLLNNSEKSAAACRKKLHAVE